MNDHGASRWLLAALVLVALLATGCGGDDDGAASATTEASTTTTASSGDGGGTPSDGATSTATATPDGGNNGGTATPTSTPTEEPTPLPDLALDWSMAPRYGVDHNGDGFIDYACNGGGAIFTRPNHGDDGGCYEIDPNGFTVTLDACDGAAEGADRIGWRVDGEDLEGADCTMSLELAEGTHEVTISAEAGGELVAGPTTRTIEVDDILIVVVGDSWTVGTGAADIPGDSDAYDAWIRAVGDWLDAQAAQQRAQRALDDAVRAARDATIIFDEADKAVDDAYDDCYTTFLGRRVVKVSGLTKCLAALGDLGVAFIEDLTKLDDRIDDALSDARRARDRAVAAEANARRAATEAVNALEAANEARRLAEGVSAGAYQHDDCARSAKAGPAQAARRIEDADPRTSVTLVHLSCSGAQVTDLIGENDQLGLAAAVTGDRTVDLLLMGFGGNDVQLNTILGDLCVRQKECGSLAPPSNVSGTMSAFCTGSATIAEFSLLLQDLNVGDVCAGLYNDAIADLKESGVMADAPIDTSARAWFEELLAGTVPRDLCASKYSAEDLHRAGLATRFDCAAAEIEDRFKDRVAPEHVVVWEYIDVVHGSGGGMCPPGIPESSGNASARSLPGFSAAELEFASNVFDTVNGEIREAATRHGWTFVATNAGSRQHGMCANDNWIARFDQSMFKAPGASTIAHPTLSGMNYLGRALADGVGRLLP
ncbi:MAG: hypothetical protein R3C39_11255 [Dehalococcoidia bacterium]